ncbi:MAG: tRNA threonylcarbamoyladenosine dehydratase [Oscillospiraceae bacterium]|nr:tRNA threonylcarbamoyladenosine dehydratase [Oscillospiraceae bacterium]
MNEQFQRTIELIGIDNINILKNRRVAVFGVGGVGGHAAEALCRSAIGAIDVFDGDIVDITNINRQLIATHKTIGRNKVDVIKERLLEINPDIVINAYKIFYLPDTADDVNLSCYDYVIDAVDTITAKLELAVRCKALNVPLICSMGAANKLDATAFEVADIYETSVCPVARIMRKELRERGIDSLKVVYSKEVPVKKEKPPSSISYVPPVAGLILAGEVIRDLIDPPLT